MARSVRGCLETAAIVVFAIAVGAFATSTMIRHSANETDLPRGGPEAGTAARPSIDRSRIRVEVRNGAGIAGAAGRFTRRLREEGFDVVDFGNDVRFDHDRTFVIDRVGGGTAAREVAGALQGLPIRSEIDSAGYIDVTVVIGADLEAVLSAGEEIAPPNPPAWRRWLDRLRQLIG